MVSDYGIDRLWISDSNIASEVQGIVLISLASNVYSFTMPPKYQEITVRDLILHAFCLPSK